ncbi:hypothetical protein TYRP_003725, partial [Tyrophagus putrescentiae]
LESSRRVLSESAIKRGGQIFGQIGQTYSDKTRREDSKSKRIFAPRPREHGQNEF